MDWAECCDVTALSLTMTFSLTNSRHVQQKWRLRNPDPRYPFGLWYVFEFSFVSLILFGDLEYLFSLFVQCLARDFFYCTPAVKPCVH